MHKVRSRTYESLDMWRGFAAILVMLFHSVANITSLPAQAPDRNLFVEFCLWGDVGVPLFFVISGYCIFAAAANTIDRKQKTRQFLVARLRRIYPTYLASLLLFITTGAVLFFVQRSGAIGSSKLAEMFVSLTPHLVLTNILLLQVPLKDESITLVSWTLCYEVAFYAVIAVAIFALRKRGWQTMLNVLHVITLVSFALVILAPRLAVFPFNLWMCFGEGVLLFDLLCGQTWQNRTKKGRVFLGTVIFLIPVLVMVRIVFAGGGIPCRMEYCDRILFCVRVILSPPVRQ